LGFEKFGGEWQAGGEVNCDESYRSAAKISGLKTVRFHWGNISSQGILGQKVLNKTASEKRRTRRHCGRKRVRKGGLQNRASADPMERC